MLIELLPLRIQSYASSLPSRRLVPKGWQLLKSTVKPRAGGKGEQKSCPWCALMTQSWQQPVCQPAQAASHSWRSFAPVLQSPVPRGWEDWIGAQDCAPIIREILPALNQTQMCTEESRNEVQDLLQVKCTLLTWGMKGLSTEGWKQPHFTSILLAVILLYFYLSNFQDADCTIIWKSG